MSIIKTPSAVTTPKAWFSQFFDNDSLFKDDFFTRNTMPAVNVKDNKTDYEIELAAPGFKKEEFKVNVENGILSITGESKGEKEEKDSNYTRKEFQYNSFTRSFSLPENADPEAINAKYEDGLLKLIIVKKNGTSTKKKEVEVK